MAAVKKYRVSAPKEFEHNNTKKTKWLPIGEAWDGQDGKIHIRIETTPLNWDGHAVLFPKDKDDGR